MWKVFPTYFLKFYSIIGCVCNVQIHIPLTTSPSRSSLPESHPSIPSH